MVGKPTILDFVHLRDGHILMDTHIFGSEEFFINDDTVHPESKNF